MRMWMVVPETMCTKHLLGEHVETHMFLGTLKKKKSISGYIKNNLFEPTALAKRHNEIVDEMIKRGMSHHTPMSESECLDAMDYLPTLEFWHSIDKSRAKQDLHGRCKICDEKYQRRADIHNSY